MQTFDNSFTKNIYVYSLTLANIVSVNNYNCFVPIRVNVNNIYYSPNTKLFVVKILKLCSMVITQHDCECCFLHQLNFFCSIIKFNYSYMRTHEYNIFILNV